MGNTSSDPNNRRITHWMQNQRSLERVSKKLLLLGPGSAGKSTLFKKLRSVHTGSLKQKELEGARPTIRQNIVSSTVVLLQQSQMLYERDNDEYKDCKIEMTETLEKMIAYVIKYCDDDFSDELSLNIESLNKLSQSIKYIWDLDSIKNVFRKRGTLFPIPDNMDYFLDRVESIMNINYIPSEQDYLKTRARTIGMTEYVYEHGRHSFHVYDVGGQRSERRKWIHQFDNVHALLYVAALNHYNAVLFEDNRVNAMRECVQLFESLVNEKWFRSSEIILLLNKDDLFRHKLRYDQIPLTKCFSKEANWPDPNEYWTIEHFQDNNELSQKENNDKFEVFHNDAIVFIENIFIKRNNNPSKLIYVHITVATDGTHVEKVFCDVQNIVIRGNLSHAGLIAGTNSVSNEMYMNNNGNNNGNNKNESDSLMYNNVNNVEYGCCCIPTSSNNNTNQSNAYTRLGS